MIEIEEKVVNKLLEISKDSHPDFVDLIANEGNEEGEGEWSCWSKFDLIICWGVILIVGLIIGGITILERF